MIRNTILMMLVIMSTLLNAQENLKSSKLEEFHGRKWQFLMDQAKLSPSEIILVKPVFMEYENAVWKQHRKNREFFKAAHNKDKNVQVNYAELNDRYAEVELMQAQQFKNYHLKLRKLLSPETLYNYYKAEREFKRKLLQEYPGRSHHDERHK